MTRNTIQATIVATLLAATAASADQYVARLDAPFDGASDRLLEALKIVAIDAFEHEGFHYIVVEAPDEGYVEAFFYAIGRAPKELHILQADWTASGLSGLSLEQRMPFLTPAHCGYCTS